MTFLEILLCDFTSVAPSEALDDSPLEKTLNVESLKPPVKPELLWANVQLGPMEGLRKSETSRGPTQGLNISNFVDFKPHPLSCCQPPALYMSLEELRVLGARIDIKQCLLRGPVHGQRLMEHMSPPIAACWASQGGKRFSSQKPLVGPGAE